MPQPYEETKQSTEYKKLLAACAAYHQLVTAQLPTGTALLKQLRQQLLELYQTAMAVPDIQPVTGSAVVTDEMQAELTRVSAAFAERLPNSTLLPDLMHIYEAVNAALQGQQSDDPARQAFSTWQLLYTYQNHWGDVCMKVLYQIQALLEH